MRFHVGEVYKKVISPTGSDLCPRCKAPMIFDHEERDRLVVPIHGMLIAFEERRRFFRCSDKCEGGRS